MLSNKQVLLICIGFSVLILMLLLGPDPDTPTSVALEIKQELQEMKQILHKIERKTK